MKRIAIALLFISSTTLFACADSGEETATSTPIDSTVENGTAPVQYGGENTANEQDTNLINSNDTGTKAQDKYEGNSATNAASGGKDQNTNGN